MGILKRLLVIPLYVVSLIVLTIASVVWFVSGNKNLFGTVDELIDIVMSLIES